MAVYGYGRVTEQGFMGFDKELNEGAWNDIIISPTLMKDGMLTVDPTNLPLEQFWKLRATHALIDLVVVYREDETGPVEDGKWDTTQRRFINQVLVYMDDPDPVKQAAAKRIYDSMTQGRGLEQTKLSYEKEVDFGRSQVFQASQKPLKSDIALLGMEPFIAEISTRTEALALIRGRGSDTEARHPYSHRMRVAKSACANAFTGIHDDLNWLIENTSNGPRHIRLMALRTPLLKLLERYPVNPTDATSPEPEEPPAEDVPALEE